MGAEHQLSLFQVRANGTGLVQLTDGPWNDFDPAFLPNGRIAFVSERRGGFLRWGRYCPTYTLFGMEADQKKASQKQEVKFTVSRRRY